MELKFKSSLMDSNAVVRSVMRMSHEIVEKNKGCDNLCLIGILRRGVPLAKMIAENIKKIENVDIDVGILDISLHRDDISILSAQTKTNATDINFDINGKNVILVDDVLFTGRTARSAMDAIISLGRPSKIQLAVLVDRGHRELPICANFTGKNIPTSRTEKVKVYVSEFDGETKVELYDMAD